MVAKNKGFTLIELMIIVGIISILAVVILATWGISSQNKAAVASYKTSMKSLATAVELCVQGGTVISPGSSGGILCSPNNNSRFPTINSRCGADVNTFIYSGTTNNWSITTQGDCRGCRLICTIEDCTVASGTVCN